MKNVSNAQKIQRMSKSLKWIAAGLMIALPIIDAGYWILGGYSFLPVQIDFIPAMSAAEIPPLSQIAPLFKFYGFLISLIPVGIALIAVNSLRKLFELYEKIEIFSEKCVRHIRVFGWMLLIGQLAYPFYCALMSLALTISNPPGHRMIVVALGLTQIWLILLASSILLISWIMEEGKKLQEEHEATV